MRGGHGRALRRLAIYPLVAILLIVVGNAAYASSNVSVPPIAPLSRESGHLARVPAAPLAAKPAPPVVTILAPSAFDQLRSDLEAIARASGGRVGISLEELSGPRRTKLSINGGQSFGAASTYKLVLLMAGAQQIASGQARASELLCYTATLAESA